MRILRLMGVFLFAIAATAVLSANAKTASGLEVYVQTDSGTVQAATIQSSDTIAQTVLTYSSLDAADAPEKIIAKGVTLGDLMSALGIEPESVQSLYLRSSDGWNKTLDYAECVAERYYFEEIVSGYDRDSADPPEFEIGTEETRERIDPMFAFFSFESRYCESPSVSDMTSSDGTRFCIGQTALADRVSVGYGKHIISITFVLKDGFSYTPNSYTSNPAPGVDTDQDQVPGEENEEYENEGLAAEDLTITVGYYGGTYYTKKVFTLNDLKSMDTVTQVYSCVDNMPAPCLNSCVGVRLTDILASAGIDPGSVAMLNFYCADVANTWYQSFTKAYLLDTVRFYYPNLAACWDYEDLEPLPGASLGAVVVDTILAYEDNWRRYGTQPDFDNLTTETRFRLMFGQTDASTPTSSRAAKWVHTIAVTLIGTAPSGITLDVSALDLEIGSKYQLTASLAGVGETTDQRIIWSSSNEDAVTVSASGRITVLSGETAVITATTAVGGLTASVVINGSTEAAVTQSEETASAESPAVESADTGSETQGEDGNPDSENPDGEAYEITDTNTGAPQEDTAVTYNRSVYLLPDTAIQFADIETENPLKMFSAAALGALFFIGLLARCILYRRRIQRTGKDLPHAGGTHY